MQMGTTLNKVFNFSLLVIGMSLWFIFVPSLAESQAGKKISNSFGMEFVYIAPATFTMGSPSDEPDRDSDEQQHRVTFTKGFYLQTTEVTQGQWKAVMGDNPSTFKKCGDNCPVETVSWDEVQDFIQKLNQKEGGSMYRLPTEAEWEYSSRAGTETPFAFGQCLSTAQANYNGKFPLSGCTEGEYRKRTLPVASFSQNAWGLYDMQGNVAEWWQDWLGGYPSGNVTDPTGPSNGRHRVRRGGGWSNSAPYCRSADRNGNSPHMRFNFIGFRLVRNP
jgi:formylglycine-generating enzyme required for sulfatase activity